MIEPINSLILRCNNNIAGWLTTHRIASDIIRYTRMFVDPDFQPLSRSILMLLKAIELQVQSQEKIPKATFIVNSENTQMIKFTKKRLMPYLDALRKSWYVEKSLG